MAHESDLIRIHTTNHFSDMRIDYGVFPSVDKLSEQDRKELLEVLETLVERLKNSNYPFSK